MCRCHETKKCSEKRRKCAKKCCPKGADLASLPVTYHTVTVDRTYPPRLNDTLDLNVVQVSSNTGGKDVLLVHGYPHAWPIYKNTLASFLASKHNLYAMDVRGFGQSGVANPDPAPGPGDLVWNADRLARDFRDVIVKLGLTKPIIVAHSLSGTQIADFLRVFGDNGAGGVGGDGTTIEADPAAAIGGIVLVGTFPVVNPIYFSAATQAILGSGGLFTQEFTKLLPTVQAFAEISDFCKLRRTEYGELLQYDMSNTVGSRAGALSIPPPADQNVPVWNSVTVKSLIVYGREDEVITSNSVPAFQSILTNSVVTTSIIPCCGHIPQYDKPDRFNTDLSVFLNSL